jgi:hypothetical protein
MRSNTEAEKDNAKRKKQQQQGPSLSDRLLQGRRGDGVVGARARVAVPQLVETRCLVLKAGGGKVGSRRDGGIESVGDGWAAGITVPDLLTFLWLWGCTPLP